MYIEAKETARLYKMLSDHLGNDTTEAMFKYIEIKTERSVEATIKTLATKDDIANLRKEMSDEMSMTRLASKDDIVNLRKDMLLFRSDTKDDITNLRKELHDEIMIVRLESKDDIANLRKEVGNDISTFRKEMGNDMLVFRKEVGNAIFEMGYKLSKDIGEAKADTTRWMFIFWVGQLAATLGIIFLFLKK